MSYDEHTWIYWLDRLGGINSLSLTLLPEPERTKMREDTHELLKEWTGEDFGYDLDAWKLWMMEHPDWETEPEYNDRFDQIMKRQAAQRAA